MPQHNTPIWPVLVPLMSYMRRVGYSDHTINQRMARMRALPVPPERATQADILASLPEGARAATKRVYVSSVAAAYRDLITLGLVDHNPALGVRIPGFHRGGPRPLPPGRLAQLLAQPDSRERLHTILGVYAGLRASDVAGLRPDDLVETEFGWALALDGKGGVRALVPAHELVVEGLRAYPMRRAGEWWRINPATVSSRWASWALAATGEKFRFHQCRHTFATRVYQASGNDLMVTRDLMRHRSVATTQVYTAVAQDTGYRAVAGL